MGGVLLFAITAVSAVLMSLLFSQTVFAISGTWKDSDTIAIGSMYYDYGGLQKVPGKHPSSDWHVFSSRSTSDPGIIYFLSSADLNTVTEGGFEADGNASGASESLSITPPRPTTTDPPSTDPTEGTGSVGGNTDGETCAIDGIGWIICPIASFIGKVNDGAYAAVEQLLIFEVPNPFSTDPNQNAIYPLWSSIRNVANVMFVLAFFAIIFSQATSVGISAYGIRKMLPKLVVAAILVNLSYYICILGIDISNVIGAGFDGLLKSTTRAVATQENGTWEKIGSTIMAGQVASTGVVAAAAVAYFFAGFFLALAATGFLAIFFTLIILLVRHALLIMLIILSPLAFVAYILPNTESLFDKWRKAFISLLVMYPLIALLFAGSKVASDVMIATHQGDRSTGGWIDSLYLLLALGVLTIPLFGVPWIVKFSGGALARFAGVMNNKGKGLVDRARKFGEEGSKVRRAEARGKLANTSFGRGLGYQRNPDGSLKYDKDGNPVKKTGLRGSLGRGVGSTAEWSRRAARNDRKRNLAERERIANEALGRSWVEEINDTYTPEEPELDDNGKVKRDADGNVIMRKLAPVQTTRSRKAIARATGGSKDQRVSDSVRAKALFAESKEQDERAAELQKVYSLTPQGADFSEGGYLEQQLRDAVTSNDTAKAVAVVNRLTNLGAGGRAALRRVMTGQQVNKEGVVVSKEPVIKVRDEEMKQVLTKAIFEDNFTTLQSDSGDLVKGAGFDENGVWQNTYKDSSGATVSGTAKLKTEVLAQQDLATLLIGESSIKYEEAKRILEDPQLRSRVATPEALKVFERVYERGGGASRSAGSVTLEQGERLSEGGIVIPRGVASPGSSTPPPTGPSSSTSTGPATTPPPTGPSSSTSTGPATASQRAAGGNFGGFNYTPPPTTQSTSTPISRYDQAQWANYTRGETPRKPDGTPMTYDEQTAWVAEQRRLRGDE